MTPMVPKSYSRFLDGRFEHYIEFARDCYEVEITPADVAAVYRHDPLANELVRRLNPCVDVESLATLLWVNDLFEDEIHFSQNPSQQGIFLKQRVHVVAGLVAPK
jgi:hypothetical protein